MAPGVAGADTPALVRAVLENAVPNAEERCAYTRTRIDGDHSRSERYEPGSVGYPWSLRSVDGRPPNDADLSHYSQGQEDRERRHPLAFDLRSMVQPDGWRLVSETPAEAVYEFRLRAYDDLDERLAEKVLGTLVVDRTTRQPRRISIVNTAPAYVAPLVRIATYTQSLSFRWDDALGMAALEQIETHWRGRALGLKVLQKHELTRYGDYRCRAVEIDAAGR